MTLEKDLMKQYTEYQTKIDLEVKTFKRFRKQLMLFRFIRILPVIVVLVGLIIYFILK